MSNAGSSGYGVSIGHCSGTTTGFGSFFFSPFTIPLACPFFKLFLLGVDGLDSYFFSGNFSFSLSYSFSLSFLFFYFSLFLALFVSGYSAVVGLVSSGASSLSISLSSFVLETWSTSIAI